jgi:hypothetical protein
MARRRQPSDHGKKKAASWSWQGEGILLIMEEGEGSLLIMARRRHPSDYGKERHPPY